MTVPAVLLSGHHANIAKWRREQALITTLKKRPELLLKAELDKKDEEFLKAWAKEEENKNYTDLVYSIFNNNK